LQIVSIDLNRFYPLLQTKLQMRLVSCF